MWNWDQGRIAYFQYDVLRAISRYAVGHDLRNTLGDEIRRDTGFEFLPGDYAPWRNYARIFKLCLIVSERDGIAVPTDVAHLLAQTGSVTCDEYMHFLAEATTSPSPALSSWSNGDELRHPLCFALKYVLARMAGFSDPFTDIDEIIGAYAVSGFSGDEDDEAFLGLRPSRDEYRDSGRNVDARLRRQARESIKVLCQISYLHNDRNEVIVSLSPEDARMIFQSINPIGGQPHVDGDAEIQRLAHLFRDGSTHDFFDYQTTTTSNELDSGFVEGNRVKRSHIVIERNSRLRNLFFRQNPSPICDACRLDTHTKYPWTDRILDLHHILPLSSGTRVDAARGTLLDDLMAICPTCHRSIHRFYDQYLRNANRRDFIDKRESNRVYLQAKVQIVHER